MDKFNIIEPKDSLAALDLEMNQWLQLPTDFKFIANDDCIRLHGCTVPEYYNRLKLMLMNTEDSAEAAGSRSNLIKESINWFTPEYSDKLLKTAQVMTNPYIVIIVPDDQNVDLTYNNYLNLNPKNRRLSDYYSMEIWGLNVRNMYEFLKANESENVGTKPSNIKLVDNIESVLYAIYDKWNKVTLEHDQAGIDKVNLIIEHLTDELPRSRQCLISEIAGSIFNESDPDKLYLPRYCPWFTLEELAYMYIDSRIIFEGNNLVYRDLVRQAWDKGNTGALLELGWNPSVEPTEKAFDKAKERQNDFLNHNFDLENHKDIRIKVDDDKFSIAFPSNLEKLYTPWFNNKGNFVGYSQSPNVYTNKDMLLVKMDPELYKNLEKKCKQLECPDKSEYNYNSGLEYVILNPVNPLDLDFKQVKEACIVDILYNLATMGLNKYQIAYPSITF